MDKKKICIITTVSVTLKSFVIETAKYLYQTGKYDVTLICSDDADFEKSLPDYLHFIPIKMSRGINLSGFSSILKFYNTFKKQKFDLVQYSTPNASCYASIAAFFARVPIRLYAQWGIRYVGLSGLSRKIFKLIEKAVCKLSTNVRAVSPKNMQFAIEEKLYSAKKAKVVGNGGTIGVDLDAFNIDQREAYKKEIRNSLGLSDKDFVYGFVGRISVDKGCGELLKAFKQLNKEYPSSKLLIVGPIENDCGIDKALIEWAEKSPAVIFTGRVDNKDMNKYYSAFDVLVHPTYREGFGMVLQEAGALGVAIITTNIPGASEVMVDGKSCLLAEPKNKEDLLNKMELLITDREKTSSLGMAGYVRTKQLYDRKIMLENQKNDYELLLDGDLK